MDKFIFKDVNEAIDLNEMFLGKNWGLNSITLTKNEINGLLLGKCIAYNDGEYTSLIYMKED